jgi:hypothetical protein
VRSILRVPRRRRNADVFPGDGGEDTGAEAGIHPASKRPQRLAHPRMRASLSRKFLPPPVLLRVRRGPPVPRTHRPPGHAQRFPMSVDLTKTSTATK